MSTRSRKGCIDCKKAKVKCDEVHPFCGTCKRRRRQCSGYNQPPRSQTSVDDAGSRNTPVTPNAQLVTTASPSDSSRLSSEGRSLDGATIPTAAFSPLIDSSNGTISPVATSSSLMISTRVPRTVPSIPAGTIDPVDEPFIELYFRRHPRELVFGPEFVHEMNSNVLKVFQNSPLAVGDSLSAIGEAYCKDSSLAVAVPIASRKARILARLRTMDNLGVSMELLLSIILGLCAVELVDANDDQHNISSLPTLLDNICMMLDHHLRTTHELSHLSKYFLRALARQDMLLSLTILHPARIPTSWWLDDYSITHADRFMGYTTTLMPLLSRLSGLAADVRTYGLEMLDSDNTIELTFPRHASNQGDLLDRASDLLDELHSWHPTVDPTLSFQASRKFFMHAHCSRQAALLYLHRLFNPPSSSVEADQTALGMAYEVMAHTTNHAEDMKMSLWPVFVASCEMQSEEDRLSATEILNPICSGRKTITALRTRNFVAHRVWAARDAGLNWDWMSLNLQYPNELLPI
ncbi:hypothetical protein LTR96_009485 [Exophiala xenobiotica]|nr:hypothetical protein LTR96_009485 [Exophiala xenobiotica]KAK5334032.1 hypothetical protein LTR98_009944 [Exophiala xenobiotica]